MDKHGARLSLIELSKHYEHMAALHPTTIDIEPGEFFSLIGPSGSGKSTLLGTVAGFVPPTSGRIELDGRDIVHIPPYRRNIGMVFQNYALFPHMSVFENIAFPLRLRKLSQTEIAGRVQSMLATVRLAEFGSRMPSQLSGGQQQRVALARAAVYDPQLLLMDEPLGALDKNLREEMQYEIKTFHRQMRATILYVTHDQEEAATMSDRLAIMKDGRIVQHGAPRDLYEHPANAFVASFLGDANLFSVESIEKRGSSSAVARTQEGIAIKLEAPARPISAGRGWMVCIRPEAVRIATEGEAEPACSVNRVKGDVVDSVYTAGTFRYRVAIGSGTLMMVRLPSVRRADLHPPGAHVELAWDASDSQLIPRDS